MTVLKGLTEMPFGLDASADARNKQEAVQGMLAFFIPVACGILRTTVLIHTVY